MRLKTKKDEITPWQTFEEKTLMSASAFASPVIKQKNSQNNDRNQYQSTSKPHKPERKRLTTIESLIRLKTSNQMTSRQNFSPLRRMTTLKLRELIPLNGNLINIMNNIHENNRKMNPQTYKHKLSAKKLPKNITKNEKTQKQRFSLDYKVSLEKRKQQIQNLKRSLFYKLNPSFDILVKVKQRLTHIDVVRQQPILRSYSIHNIRLNTIEQKDITNVISTDRTNTNRLKSYFNSTSQNFRPKSDMRNQVTKKRIISSMSKKENGHIIDRLYDRFQ